MSATLTPAPVALDGLPNGPLSPQRLARATGALYVVLAVLGMLGPLTLESVVTPGDPIATADAVSQSQGPFAGSLLAWVTIVAVDVALSVTLYLLLAPVSRGLSLLAAAFRLVYSAAVGAMLGHLFAAYGLLTGAGGRTAAEESVALNSLEVFGAGFLAALVFFGVHLVVLGGLLYRSRYLPRVLAALVVAAGVGYVVDSLASLMVDGYGGAVSAVLLAPAVLGELGLAAWLLIKGVTLGR